jgi:hypothetical protein
MRSPWKFLCASATGTSHESRGERCQDYAHVRIIGTGELATLVLVGADGAGSAASAEVGARLACLGFLHAVTAALENGLPLSSIEDWHVLQWYEQARRRLSLEACIRNLDLDEFACTLLTAIVGQERAVFSQIGDGAIVVKGPEGYQTVFWPQNGEYANTTFFLTGSDFEQRLVFRSLGQSVDELAMLTDGLQPLALHYASRSVHAPFFDPMFKSLHATLDEEDLEGPLLAFLTSKQVNDRTDDDKTLVLATRRSPIDDSCKPL